MPSVFSSLRYFLPPEDGTRPYLSTYKVDPATGEAEKNFAEAWYKMEIEDIRGKEEEYTLDTNGFQLYKRPSKHTEFVDDAEIREEYYPECIQFIKDLTGASEVLIFDHTIRRRKPGQKDSAEARQPVPSVHVDQTAKASRNRVYRHLPASEAEKRVQGRYQIINLWRPIGHPAFDYPLAFCDWTSTNKEEGADFAPTALKYPDYDGEIMNVKFNPEHKWKYWKGMTPEEFVLIKCADSKEGVAEFTPHTSFEDPSTPPSAPYRQSIEVRTLVFYD
ncbi:hypothetical protein NEOLEDRAFT_1134504 [Neolentinus lepideus HHB14362 ss-1]|uniref:Methyltransferase n=1 Tax=Neolentinus lepideus HHB14362 ss-1 TaxID=1314782 RepID=A0A165S973_9AGAM|nr:hypothetical protein NEOLEDRAFT_1134504 [Neolentinus lepideus HHB14362 ss-1]